MSIQSICVYCASSEQIDPSYHEAAKNLGKHLAKENKQVVYGGGARGSMGALADGVRSGQGRIIGIIPTFMIELEWAYSDLTQLIEVSTMHERKQLMIEHADAVVVLPGGCGTFEEFFEALTWKKLGIFTGPIILLNTNGFFDDCLNMLNRCIKEGFMGEQHALMWDVVNEPEQVLPQMKTSVQWSKDAVSFAAL